MHTVNLLVKPPGHYTHTCVSGARILGTDCVRVDARLALNKSDALYIVLSQPPSVVVRAA